MNSIENIAAALWQDELGDSMPSVRAVRTVEAFQHESPQTRVKYLRMAALAVTAYKEMPPAIPLLDNGFIRLIDFMGSDLSVVRAARVSYDAAWRAGEDQGSDDRLIKYLWKNGHTTPFEAVTFTFEVKAPIFVFRQWHRHRTQSYNELSARYKELPEEFYVPEPEVIGKQSAKSKQARVMTGEPDKISSSIMHEAGELAFRAYNQLLQRGVPRELARTVLPVSTYTHMFTTMNLLNLMKFIALRDHEHAQWEIRQYAQAVRTLAETVAPVSIAAGFPVVVQQMKEAEG